MRFSLRFAVGTPASRADRGPRLLAGLSAVAVLLAVAIFTFAQAETPSPVALLQEETPAAAADPPEPTPQERRAAKEALVADLASRLAAGRDEEFEDDLAATILASQQEITAETATISQAVSAANIENRLELEQAEFDTGFAQRYLESATGRLPIPHIISINFPSNESDGPNSSLMPAEHWNIAPRASAAADVELVDDRGEPTPAQLSFGSQSGGEVTPIKGGMRSDRALMAGGIRSWYAAHRQLHGPPVTVRIEGLHLAMQRGYQVYVYVGVGLGLEPGGPAPFQISIGEETPVFGGQVMNAFHGEWVRIDGHNGHGNYLVTPLLSHDELLIEMAPVGFYPGIELGTTAINALQLVGARPRTTESEEEEMARAAASARSAQGKLIQASQQLGGVPAEVTPNATARLARLAKWQERVADQIEGLRRSDYAAVITALQQELAEVPPTL